MLSRETASDYFSSYVAFFWFFGRYRPGSGMTKVVRKDMKVIIALITIGSGAGKLIIVGAIAPHPTATDMQSIVTEPTLFGGTRSSTSSIPIFNQPPSIPTSKKTAK